MLASLDDAADCDAATGRLLDYYLHAAVVAGQHIAQWGTTAGRLPPGGLTVGAPPLSTPEQAVAWLEAERPNLHAAVGSAAVSGRSLHANAIPSALTRRWKKLAPWKASATVTCRQATPAKAWTACARPSGFISASMSPMPVALKKPFVPLPNADPGRMAVSSEAEALAGHYCRRASVPGPIIQRPPARLLFVMLRCRWRLSGRRGQGGGAACPGSGCVSARCCPQGCRAGR